MMEQQPSIPERLAIVYQRLAQAPPCASADEALALLVVILEAVEDEFSGVVKNPHSTLMRDGRMYAPQADHITLLPDGSKIARSRRHEILLGTGGSFRFTEIASQKVEFEKEGIINA